MPQNISECRHKRTCGQPRGLLGARTGAVLFFLLPGPSPPHKHKLTLKEDPKSKAYEPTAQHLSTMDDANFRRMYAKAIAEALQAKEEDEKNQSRNNSSSSSNNLSHNFEKAQQAYSELCHDDPIVSGDAACICLARALTPRTNNNIRRDDENLGLCPRLVDGLLQAVTRAESKSSSSGAAIVERSNDTTTNAAAAAAGQTTNEPSSSFGPSSIATKEGYARLAFSVFIEGPYRCIQQSDNLCVASSFLGSLEPPPREGNVNNTELSSEEKSKLVEDATKSIVDGLEQIAMDEERTTIQEKASSQKVGDDGSSSSSSEFFHNKRNQKSIPQKVDNDSLEEIFAEDSDPDDFDFGPDVPYDGNTVGAYYSESENGFDPLKLSQPNDNNQTWDGARKAIMYLMSHLSYGNLLLSSLSSRTWLDMGASDTLADFAFMLLLHNTQDANVTKLQTNEGSLLIPPADVDTDDNNDISALWDRPLFLLRDRALDSNHNHDALVPYLQLLQAFLSHSENAIMSILSSSKKSSSLLLPPITSVGLSGLATLCSSKELTCASASKMNNSSVLSICPRDEVKKTIVSSLYSLAHVLQCVRPRKLDTSQDRMDHERLWIRTAACIFPIIEYLTNLRARFDFQSVFEVGSGGNNYVFNEADAKCIMDSGVFRELLGLYADAIKYSMSDDETHTSEASNVTRMQLLRTIYSLCIMSQEVLGKYAVRVPDLAREVQSAAFTESHVIDGILWTSLSSSILESKLDAPASRLKLRAGVKLKNSSHQADDDTSMAKRSCAGFASLCDSVQLALKALKENISKSSADNEDISKEVLEKQKKTLGDIVCFANCLANCNNATNIWIGCLNNEEAGKAREKLSELRSVLSAIPSYSNELVQIPCEGHKKNDDKDATQKHPREGAPKQKEITSMQKQKEFGKMAASIRSSIKIIAAALDSKGRSMSLKGGMACNVSSKTD
eukprot:scaffold101785_cov82-Cyclotella_meneghiniana.AAC.1